MRALSRLGEKAIPLYQMMKKTNHFVWSDAANDMFEALKKQPVFAAPIDKEPLLLYVAANAWDVSVAIVVERKEAGKECPVQWPVYCSYFCSYFCSLRGYYSKQRSHRSGSQVGH